MHTVVGCLLAVKQQQNKTQATSTCNRRKERRKNKSMRWGSDNEDEIVATIEQATAEEGRKKKAQTATKDKAT